MKFNKQATKKELAINAKKEEKTVKQGKGMWGHNSKYLPNTQRSSPSQTYY